MINEINSIEEKANMVIPENKKEKPLGLKILSNIFTVVGGIGIPFFIFGYLMVGFMVDYPPQPHEKATQLTLLAISIFLFFSGINLKKGSRLWRALTIFAFSSLSLAIFIDAVNEVIRYGFSNFMSYMYVQIIPIPLILYLSFNKKVQEFFKK